MDESRTYGGFPERAYDKIYQNMARFMVLSWFYPGVIPWIFIILAHQKSKTGIAEHQPKTWSWDFSKMDFGVQPEIPSQPAAPTQLVGGNEAGVHIVPATWVFLKVDWMKSRRQAPYHKARANMVQQFSLPIILWDELLLRHVEIATWRRKMSHIQHATANILPGSRSLTIPSTSKYSSKAATSAHDFRAY